MIAETCAEEEMARLAPAACRPCVGDVAGPMDHLICAVEMTSM